MVFTTGYSRSAVPITSYQKQSGLEWKGLGLGDYINCCWV